MSTDPKRFITYGEARAELHLLRALIGDRLEEHGITVKPEDVADVVRWAQHPDAVRELLRHTPEIAVGDDSYCPDCDSRAGEAHGSSVGFPSALDATRWRVHCAIAAAWRALGDPRGAEDIERAHEEALRENEQRRSRANGYATGGWVGTAMHAAQRDEMVEVRLSPGAWFASGTLAQPTAADISRRFNRATDEQARLSFERGRSDARGMEAVISDAWREWHDRQGVVSTPERFPDGTYRDP